MIPFLAPLLASSTVKGAGAFVGAWWKALLGMVLGALMCWPIASCQGERKGRAAERAAWELRVAEVARLAVIAQRAADANLRRAEAAENALITGNRQEINNALANIPDQALSPRQRAIVCVRLRREGGSASAIAAACGSAQPPR